MPRTEEAQWWFDAVYDAVQKVPRGKVTSYGHIARLLGRPERSRQVGVCLKHLPSYNDDVHHHYHNRNVPWQRVINSKGQISPRGPNGASRQAQALRREHVRVDRNAMGELSIDLTTYGWFPDSLPADGDAADEDDQSDAAGETSGAEGDDVEAEESAS